MRVLILGGTGAMGEPLVRQLCKRGDDVYVTSRRNRESSGSVHYIQGNALDFSFIKKELDKNYDAIVDFMIYSTEDFKEKLKCYLNSTKQYIFLSSARVYADSKELITENSPRLLDVCKDIDYLKTDEYALAKARCENMLFNSDKKNWTIIRPYITYNIKRLQLGGLELGQWLTAVLLGSPIVLPKDVGSHETTMTYGEDVARVLTMLIGNNQALGEAFHITGDDHKRWSDIAEIYRNEIERYTGCRPEVYEPDTSEGLFNIMGNAHQICYDRMFDRVFDNSKLSSICRCDFKFMKTDEGLRLCINQYFDLHENQKEKYCDAKFMAWLDKSTGRVSKLNLFSDTKEKLKYLGYYYVPDMVNVLKGFR